MTAVYSWTERDKDHVNKQAYGPHPDGLITYTADGRMSVIEVYDNRKPLSADREAAPVEEDLGAGGKPKLIERVVELHAGENVRQ